MDWIRDLRYAARVLRGSPGFAVVAILTLALGIGAATAIFSVVDAALLNPLPYPEPDSIVRVLEATPEGGLRGTSTLNFLHWQRQSSSFEFLAAQTLTSMTISGIDAPVFVRGARVSPHYFDIAKTQPALGRLFLDEEAEPGKDRVAVLSNALWLRSFGADPSIVGRAVQLDGEAHTVVGVLPPGTSFDRGRQQIWTPMAFKPSEMTRDFRWFGVFGRLKRGVTLQQAQVEMKTIAARIAAEHPETNKGWSVAVDRFADILLAPGARLSMIVLMAAVGMLLLTGCANLANLALSRAVARERDAAVRASLGAGRWRMARQSLTEYILLSACGGGAGVAIGYAAMRALSAALPAAALPAEVQVTMSMRVLLFALAVSICTGILFGLAPVLHATNPNLAAVMKEGGRGVAGGARRGLRNSLVVAEVALAFVLLTGAGLMLRTFFQLLDVEMGFKAVNVLTMRLPVAPTRFPEPAQLEAYLRQIRTAVEGVPGVRSTALTSALPLQGWAMITPFAVAGRAESDHARWPFGFYKIVSPSYFETLGITVRKGRALTERDTAGAPRVLMMNETAAKRHFASEEPVGQRLLIPYDVPGTPEYGKDVPWEIVGVIADEKINNLSDQRSAGVYVSLAQSPHYSPSLAIRSGVEPRSLERSIRQAIAQVSREQAVSDVRTMEEIRSESLVAGRLEALLLGVFGGLALLLAAIGIYGVMSYTVVQRTHELGLRAALGAKPADLMKLVLGSGLLLTLAGLAIGFAGALALTRVMTAILFGVTPHDPATMASVAAILAVVALAACAIPAWRAMRVDPAVALRQE